MPVSQACHEVFYKIIQYIVSIFGIYKPSAFNFLEKCEPWLECKCHTWACFTFHVLIIPVYSLFRVSLKLSWNIYCIYDFWKVGAQQKAQKGKLSVEPTIVPGELKIFQESYENLYAIIPTVQKYFRNPVYDPSLLYTY